MIALLWPTRRLGRSDFVFGLALALILSVGGAALAYTGRGAGGLLYLVGNWVWLVVHANRRHDHDRSGAGLVFVWPLVLIGTALAAAVLVAATGVGMPGPSDRPTGEEPVFVYAYVAGLLIMSSMGFEWTGPNGISGALAAVALTPLAATLILSILIGSAPEAQGPTRWGPPG